MNSNGSIIQTPFHGSHSHFYDYIPDFPGLPKGADFEQNHHEIVDILKKFYITPFPWEKCKNKKAINKISNSKTSFH